jgi:hypothetical protein
MVGRRLDGREVTRTMCVVGGGSSSVFRSAFDDSSFSLSASSMINTRAAPSAGRKLLSDSRLRMAST